MRASWLVVALLLSAGCLTKGPAPGAESPPPLPGPTTATPVETPAETPVEPAPEAAVPPPASIVVVRLPFHKTFDAAKSTVASLVDVDASFDVDATGATAVVLELAWNSTTFDLDPTLVILHCDELTDPAGCMVPEAQSHWLSEGDDGNYWVKDGSLGAPDGPVRIDVGPEALASYGCLTSCQAVARAITKDAAVDVGGQLVVSVFRGGPPPAGYSALAA